jgi:PAS domain S-box-containing protein
MSVALSAGMLTAFADHPPAPRSAEPADEELVRLRLAVEASGEIIFITDLDGIITYVNPEFVRVYGYTAQEIVGRATPRMLSSGSTPAEEYAAFWRELMANRVVRKEFVNRTKSGALVHIESSANPIVRGGERIGFLAVQRDITDRKATEEALRRSESRYRTLAEAAHDSIFIVNREGELEYANTVSTGRFGIRNEDAIGKNLHDVFDPATAEEMWRGLSIVFESGDRHYFEARFDSPTGELWLGAWLVAMPNEGAATRAVLGVARDITEQKRLEKQFLQAQKMEAIGQLTGGIAHDFNNLLTAILGYSELILQREQLEPDLVADLEEIKKAGDRARRLTRQLLTFSRKQVTTARVLDFNEVVAELHKMLRRLINEDIDLEIAGDSDLACVKADSGQVEQLIVNLAVNARDAMPHGGRLRIATANVELDASFTREHDGLEPGRYVSLSMHDTGSGMTPEVMAHVFEPFFTTKPAGKGTGLGLATIYGIVKQSGGCVVIASEPGVGTTVTTYWPAVAEASIPDSSSLPVAAPRGGTETILLVEDEAGLRALMARTLSRSGYRVLNAANVTEAIDIAERRATPIDLLLTDVVMPGLNGPDLAQRVVPHWPAIKVLYVTGFDNVTASGSLSKRATLLHKPFTPDALAATVRQCLDRERSDYAFAADRAHCR